MTRGVLLRSAWLVGAAAAAAGCAAPGGDEAVRQAQTFVQSSASSPSAACAMLAPRTRVSLTRSGRSCAAALADLDLAPVGAGATAVIAGHSAIVSGGADTVFLALFDDGWRITAAGCRRVSTDEATPYECDLEGA